MNRIALPFFTLIALTGVGAQAADAKCWDFKKPKKCVLVASVQVTLPNGGVTQQTIEWCVGEPKGYDSAAQVTNGKGNYLVDNCGTVAVALPNKPAKGLPCGGFTSGTDCNVVGDK